MQRSYNRVVYDGGGSPSLCSATFPQVLETSSGRLLVTFRGAPTKAPGNTGEQAVLCVSDDSGRTFTPPRSPFSPPLIDGQKPSTIRMLQLLDLGGGRLFGAACVVEKTEDHIPYFDEATEGIKDTRIFTFFSEDDGNSFSPLTQLDLQNQYAGLCHVLTGPPLLTSDGRVMVNFEVYKRREDPRGWEHNAACIFSQDGGRTFGPERTILSSAQIYGWDHRAFESSPGVLQDAVWAFSRVTNNYLPIHFCESLDGGDSWSALWDTGISGQPGNAVRLPDGRTAFIYIDRTHHPVIRLCFSSDGCRSFGEAFPVYSHEQGNELNRKSLYKEAWSEMNKFTVGHPFVILLRDGRLLCVYYAGHERDKTNICLTWVEL